MNEAEQDAIGRSVSLLMKLGPSLSRSHPDTVKGSRHSNLKEFRSQVGGRPLRTFVAFDFRRTAIVLIGGDKTGDKRFYGRLIPLADDLYDAYLNEIREEGLL